MSIKGLLYTDMLVKLNDTEFVCLIYVVYKFINVKFLLIVNHHYIRLGVNMNWVMHISCFVSR